MTHSTPTTKRLPLKLILPALIFVLFAAVSYYAAPYVKAAAGITKIGCINCPPENYTPLGSAYGMTVDKQDNVYVIDYGNDYVWRIHKFDSSGTYINDIGDYSGPYGRGSGDGQLNNPLGLATDSDNNLYVADSNNNRIQKFDSSGNFLAKYGANNGDGTAGSGDGEFNYPGSIAVAPGGNIYVADGGNTRIQKLNGNGSFVAKWGTTACFGDEFNDNTFCQIGGIAVDANEQVYVTDSSFNRVMKFDSNGNFLAKWGTNNGNGPYGATGTAQGEFGEAYGLATDTSNNVYVTDRANNSVQKFTSSGSFLLKIGSYGVAPNAVSSQGYDIPEDQYLFQSPSAVAVNSSGNIYVADTYSSRVQKFDANGQYISSIGGLVLGSYGGLEVSSADGRFRYPYDVAFDPSGNIFVADYSNNRIQKLDTNGNYITKWGGSYGAYGNGDGELYEPFGLSVDRTGVVYVADSNNNRVQKFDNNGNYIAQFGYVGPYGGNGDGELNFPLDTVNDTTGNVYIADTNNGRIQKFDNNGNFLAKSTNDYSLGLQSMQTMGGVQALGDVAGPYRLAIDTEGNIWAVSGFVLFKYSSDLTLLQSWPLYSEQSPYFTYAVTIDSQNNMYLGQIGEATRRIVKVNAAIEVIATWSPDEFPENFFPLGLQADLSSPGRLAIADPNLNQVLILCDHDVSSNNCTGSSGGGQTLTYPDPVKGSTVTLVLPSDVTNPTVSAVDPKSLPKDSAGSYPAGLTTFQFTTTPGATKTVTLYYDLPGNPSDYTARKYKTDSQTYLDIPGATITREDYNGKSMLKLTYNITDGGILDQDGLANGTVIDPVGLATTKLADTGENTWVYLLASLSLIGVGLGLAIAKKSTKY